MAELVMMLFKTQAADEAATDAISGMAIRKDTFKYRGLGKDPNAPGRLVQFIQIWSDRLG